MGVGKSTVGEKISKQLQIKFTDTDKLIQFNEKSSITNIFKYKGEKYFRDLETKYLKEIKEGVVSCGGGLPIHSDNMHHILQNGTSFYLKDSINSLFNKLIKVKRSRPLLNNLNNNQLRCYIEEELHKREKFYKKANYTINLENKKIKDTLRQINSLIVSF